MKITKIKKEDEEELKDENVEESKNILLKRYYRIMPGSAGSLSKLCYDTGFIGVDYGIKRDIGDLEDKSNNERIKSLAGDRLDAGEKIRSLSASLSSLFRLAFELNIGDIVISPDGDRKIMIGRVISKYHYEEGQELPHRIDVDWLSKKVSLDDLSTALRNSMGALGSLAEMTKHRIEIQKHILKLKGGKEILKGDLYLDYINEFKKDLKSNILDTQIVEY